MLLTLQKGIVYGPVRSRRLGRSLGINPLPHGKKTCTLNCLYCQYGWTDPSCLSWMKDGDAARSFPSAERILEEVGRALEAACEPPAYITFSGNGEPTLHPRFPELVEGVLRLRDRYAKASRTAVLSNSTTVLNPVVREALRRLDVRIMKLDCGTPERFRRFNQPVAGAGEDNNDVAFLRMVEELRAIGRGVTIQVLFAGGPEGNFRNGEIEEWVERIAAISPASVQIYTLDRESPSKQITRLENAELVRVKRLLDAKAISAAVF
jgi:wyosine [tRNA(Phe)-imidazoG37] synthetase (radical SAM superfamily)